VTALIFGAMAAPNAALGPKAAIGAFVLFCRIGGCLMLAPGFSNSQIPTQVRLFVALAITLTLTPLLLDRVPAAVTGDDPILTLKVIAVESLVGGMIGVLARMFYLALEALAVGAATILDSPVRPDSRSRTTSPWRRWRHSSPSPRSRSCSRPTFIGSCCAASWPLTTSCRSALISTRDWR
jgi:Bacterial export proteins, family 1